MINIINKIDSLITEASYSDFKIVYHESDVDGIKEFDQSKPSNYRAGGIGSGIYVTPDGSNNLYGKHLYKCRLKFNPNAQTIYFMDEAYGDGVKSHPFLGSSGEFGASHYPFEFEIKGDKYFVGGSRRYNVQAVITRKRQRELARLILREDMRDLSDLPEIVKEAIFSLDEESKLGRYVEYYDEDAEKLLNNLTEYDEFEDGYESYIENEFNVQKGTEDFEDALEMSNKEVTDSLQKYINQIKENIVDDYKMVLKLYEIGSVVKEYGYKAVWFVGMRQNVTFDKELLVFDDNDIEIIEQIE